MNNFSFHSPTEFVFGKDTEKQTGLLCKKYGATRVLIVYGGGSVVRSGLLQRVEQSLEDAGISYVELGGIQPNPTDPKVYEGIDLARRERVDMLLPIGGGSVIDTAKAIAAGVPYEGDFWDFFIRKAIVKKALKVGVVLTIPAAGSEMSNGCVITNEVGSRKRAYNNDLARPKFAIMNPERTFSLSTYQTACGIVDIMMHTMERYFSQEDDMILTDELAESLLRTVKNSAYKVMLTPEDYRHRAQVMWAGSLSHNGLTGCGTVGDYATHMLEHELSALFDVAHGAGLAALWGSWARYVFKDNISRFVRFAVNVMGLPNDFTNPESTALAGIEAMERFYHDMSMPISIQELIGRDIADDEIRLMAEKCSLGNTSTIGNFKKLNMEDMEEIYRMAR